MRIQLPTDYLVYVEGNGVSEAFTDGPPGYMALWALNEVEEINRTMNVPRYAPGLLGCGGGGGGEMLAFDASDIVYMLLMIGLEPKCVRKTASSWAELSKRIRSAT